jgi:drug/metabolite transporter (DMT)-like permease
LEDGRVAARWSGGRDAALFLLLGLIWGGSYAAIKVALDAGVTPITLVANRLALGAIVLGVIVAGSRAALPRRQRTYLHLTALSLLNMVVPFTLIGWAEERVDSSVAAVIGAAIPIMVVVMARLVLGEPLGPQRLVGVVLGFVGVAVLTGFDPARLVSGLAAPIGALMAATASYALGVVYARRTVRDLPPVVPAFLQVAIAFVIATIAASATGKLLPPRIDLAALAAIGWLGFLSSGLAYLIYFRLIGRWGAARSSTFAYLLPVVGLLAGAAFLREPVGPSLVLGAGLVAGGIAVVSRKPIRAPAMPTRRRLGGPLDRERPANPAERWQR